MDNEGSAENEGFAENGDSADSEDVVEGGASAEHCNWWTDSLLN